MRLGTRVCVLYKWVSMPGPPQRNAAPRARARLTGSFRCGSEGGRLRVVGGVAGGYLWVKAASKVPRVADRKVPKGIHDVGETDD